MSKKHLAEKPVKKKTSGYMRLHKMLSGIVRFFLRVRIIGRENVPTEGGMVVCANHISMSDPVAVAAAFPRQLTFLAKAELFHIPLLRSLIRALGAYPLDRRGDVSAIKNAISMASDGMPVLIFPQGTRRAGKNPADTPIKSGAGMIALHAGVPLLPVCIRCKKMKFRLFRRIEVIFGKPIDASTLGLTDLTSESFTAATKYTFNELCTLGGFEKNAPDASSAEEGEDSSCK